MKQASSSGRKSSRRSCPLIECYWRDQSVRLGGCPPWSGRRPTAAPICLAQRRDTMRYAQLANARSSSNRDIPRTISVQPSWAASRAPSPSPVRRHAWATSFFCQRRASSSNAWRSPAFAEATRYSSSILAADRHRLTPIAFRDVSGLKPNFGSIDMLERAWVTGMFRVKANIRQPHQEGLLFTAVSRKQTVRDRPFLPLVLIFDREWSKQEW